MRPELLLAPAFCLFLCVLVLRHVPLGRGWWLSSLENLERVLTEGDWSGRATQVAPGSSSAKASRVASPSVSACLGGANDPWPALPDNWTAADVELTLMDIEYAEAYRG